MKKVVVKQVSKTVKSAIGLAQMIVTLIVSRVILVLLGLVFFVVNLWIVKFRAGLLRYSLSGDWAVFAAAILSAASMIGSRGIYEV